MITLAAKFKMDYRIVSIWVYQKRSSAKSTLVRLLARNVIYNSTMLFPFYQKNKMWLASEEYKELYEITFSFQLTQAFIQKCRDTRYVQVFSCVLKYAAK